MDYDQNAVERKWQQIWKDALSFEANPKAGHEKFFCTFPYPYVNGRPHVGHLFTMMRVEAFARYKRMRGYNVLFPQGWHCTGQPLVNAGQLVAEGEEKQMQILRDFGVPEAELAQFTNPEHWIKYFAPRYREDVENLGMSIDWRREFITTSLNPHYDHFIRWQVRKLKEKGYLALGKHPVVWCPKELAPVSDHGRRSGEGETPQEYVLIFFKRAHANEYLVVATLRPETIDGVTNLWANPAITYVRATVDGATWIVSQECIEKLKEQEHVVHVLGTVSGAELVGTSTTFDGKTVPVLPASFPTAAKGTGLVMSVPSDAPDDYIALRDITKNEKLIAQYKLHDIVSHLKPIPIIDAGELGHLAAVKVVEDMKIQHQNERDRLEQAKKLVYKKGYYEGVMLAGPYKGEKVETAKNRIKESLLATKQAALFYELTGPVVCRCLTACIVKIVQNQWFITYNNPEWKALTHQALDGVTLYPEKARAQFNYVIDWLNAWAATRSEGLGTRLPWDEHWLVESLTDSTFYMAYYTIAHHIKDLPITEVNDVFFDYVFLGKGTPHHGWEKLRAEFLYWYPLDFRNSGKDLVQNHLTFMLFTHTALLPNNPELWPKGIGVNGWVTVDGQKMSKSLGNVIPVRNMITQYGADASRLTILNGGEGMDDPNWDSNLAQATKLRLAALVELAGNVSKASRTERQPLDDWFESKLHSMIKHTTEAMEGGLFRQALQHAYFEWTNTLKQYLKLTNNNPQHTLLRSAVEAQTKLLQPFTPHACAEAWEKLGHKTVLAHEHWPVCDETKIKPELEASQDLIEQLTSDIRNVQTLLRIEQLKGITIIVAANWKYELVQQIKDALSQTRDVREVMGLVLKVVRKEHAGDVTKLIPVIVKDPARLPPGDVTQAREFAAVNSASEYLHKVFSAPVTVVVAEDSKEAKAKQAFPGKPAILLH